MVRRPGGARWTAGIRIGDDGTGGDVSVDAAGDGEIDFRNTEDADAVSGARFAHGCAKKRA